MFYCSQTAAIVRSMRNLRSKNVFGINSDHVLSCLRCSSYRRDHRKYFHHGGRLLSTGDEATRELKPKPNAALPVQTENIATHEIKERFIPLTRRTLLRLLLQEEGFLSEDEKRQFEKFAAALDAATVNIYHGYLTELKALFDPINPDKDTVQTREINRKDCIDNEFWLLQKLSIVMEKANFNELPKAQLLQSLSERVKDGLVLSVNPDRYDVLRFWVVGRETPEQRVSWFSSLISRKIPPKSLEYYKRIVLAIRLKRDQKLVLKMFKQVPMDSLEQLLPDGNIRMTKTSKSIIKASLAVGTLGVLAKLISFMANQEIHWTLVLSCASVIVALQSMLVHQNRKRNYLVDMTRLLYFKNIANNRSLLTILVDRAQDESFKEALLVYTMLLTNRPASTRAKPSEEQLPQDLGGLPTPLLKRRIEDWISEKTKMHIDFDSSGAVNTLKGFGLLSDAEDKFNVLPLAISLRHLPQQPETIVLRQEVDVNDIEGFDRDSYLECERHLKEEDIKSKKYGWF